MQYGFVVGGGGDFFSFPFSFYNSHGYILGRKRGKERERDEGSRKLYSVEVIKDSVVILKQQILQQIFTFCIHYFRTNGAARYLGYSIMILLEYQS